MFFGVLGINRSYQIFYRVGVSKSDKGGYNWLNVDDLLKHISNGESGVWRVNSEDKILFRKAFLIIVHKEQVRIK